MSYAPIPLFYYELLFGDEKLSFQEVSGLLAKTAPNTAEGGDVHHVHILPHSKSRPNLVLKRGLSVPGHSFATWCTEILNGLNGLNLITLHDLSISLVNADGEVLKTWILSQAYPVKMEVSNLMQNDADLFIASVELSFKHLEEAS